MTQQQVGFYRYRIYYEWQGPSPSDPLVQEKTAAEIESALRVFPSELGHRLGDISAEVKSSGLTPGSTEVQLSVTTAAAPAALQAALTATLQNWRLFGEEIEASAP